MALILNIDTSSKSTSVALAEDGIVLACIEEHEVVSHASKLTPFITDVLEKSNKKMQDLNAIAISIGPGSYTGLRIGLSAAKGLCYALKIPIISLSSLEAMLHELKKRYEKNNKLFVSTMNSRKNEIYCALYDDASGKITPPQAVVLEDSFLNTYENEQVIMGGTGIEKVKKLNTKLKIKYIEDINFSAQNMALPSNDLFLKKRFADLAYLEPEYLKPFMTT